MMDANDDDDVFVKTKNDLLFILVTQKGKDVCCCSCIYDAKILHVISVE